MRVLNLFLKVNGRRTAAGAKMSNRTSGFFGKLLQNLRKNNMDGIARSLTRNKLLQKGGKISLNIPLVKTKPAENGLFNPATVSKQDKGHNVLKKAEKPSFPGIEGMVQHIITAVKSDSFKAAKSQEKTIILDKESELTIKSGKNQVRLQIVTANKQKLQAYKKLIPRLQTALKEAGFSGKKIQIQTKLTVKTAQPAVAKVLPNASEAGKGKTENTHMATASEETRSSKAQRGSSLNGHTSVGKTSQNLPANRASGIQKSTKTQTGTKGPHNTAAAAKGKTESAAMASASAETRSSKDQRGSSLNEHRAVSKTSQKPSGNAQPVKAAAIAKTSSAFSEPNGPQASRKSAQNAAPRENKTIFDEMTAQADKGSTGQEKVLPASLKKAQKESFVAGERQKPTELPSSNAERARKNEKQSTAHSLNESDLSEQREKPDSVKAVKSVVNRMMQKAVWQQEKQSTFNTHIKEAEQETSRKISADQANQDKSATKPETSLKTKQLSGQAAAVKTTKQQKTTENNSLRDVAFIPTTAGEKDSMQVKGRQLTTRIEQIIQQFEQLKLEGKARTVFKLSDSPMGEMEIHLKHQKSGRQISLLVESDSIKAEVQKLLPQIQQSLAARGLSFSALSVDVGSFGQAAEQAARRNTHRQTTKSAKGKEASYEHETSPVRVRQYGYNTIEIVA